MKPLLRTRTALATGLSLYAAIACAPASEDREVSAGEALFVANCQDCHGERGLGDGPMAANLPAQPANLTEHLGHHTMAQLVNLIQSGVPPAMPPAPLSEDEIRLVIDHLWTLVPEDQVAALRQMQQHMEMMGDSGMMDMPGMGGMGQSGDDMPGMDHSTHAMPQTPPDGSN